MDVVVISANTSWYLFNFRKNTIITLLEQGFEVYAIAPKDDYSQKLEQIGAKYVEINIDRAGKNPIKDLFTIIKYFLLYFRIKPQVVFNFTPKTNIYSTVAAKLVGASSVNNIAGLGLMFVGQSLSTKLVKFLYRVTQWMSAHIYFQNQDDMKLFIENKLVPSQHSISRLPGSGVDLKRFSLQELPETDAANFILVARLLVEKGVELYAEAARQLKAEYPDANFYLLGFFDEENPSGVSRGQVANWEKQGIIEYLGVTDNIEQTLKVATCVVLQAEY